MTTIRTRIRSTLAGALVGLAGLALGGTALATTPSAVATKDASAQDGGFITPATPGTAGVLAGLQPAPVPEGSGTGSHAQTSAAYRISSTTLVSYLWSARTQTPIPAGQIELMVFDRHTANATLRTLGCTFNSTTGPATDLVLYSDWYMCPELGGFVVVSFWADNLLAPFVHYYLIVP